MSTEFDQMDNGDWLRYWSIEGQKQLERNQKVIEALQKENEVLTSKLLVLRAENANLLSRLAQRHERGTWQEGPW